MSTLEQYLNFRLRNTFVPTIQSSIQKRRFIIEVLGRDNFIISKLRKRSK